MIWANLRVKETAQGSILCMAIARAPCREKFFPASLLISPQPNASEWGWEGEWRRERREIGLGGKGEEKTEAQV